MAVTLVAVDRPENVPVRVIAAAFVGPTLVLLGIGLVHPALRTVWGSLRGRDGSEVVGLENHQAIFTIDGLQVVPRSTVLWVVLVPLIATLFGLVYAYLVDRTRFENFANALVFLPVAISGVAAGVIWTFVYEYRPDQGAIQQIGLANQVPVRLGGEPQQLLLDQPGNTFFHIVVMIWIDAGFAMTVLSAAIKAIPDDLTEAARLDGVSGIGMFRHVTVPSIRPALVVVLTTVAIGTLKVFDIVVVMTGGQFGTSVLADEFSSQSFRQFDQGLGSALAVLLFVLVVSIVVDDVRQLRLSEEIR